MSGQAREPENGRNGYSRYAYCTRAAVEMTLGPRNEEPGCDVIPCAAGCKAKCRRLEVVFNGTTSRRQCMSGQEYGRRRRRRRREDAQLLIECLPQPRAFSATLTNPTLSAGGLFPLPAKVFRSAGTASIAEGKVVCLDIRW